MKNSIFRQLRPKGATRSSAMKNCPRKCPDPDKPLGDSDLADTPDVRGQVGVWCAIVVFIFAGCTPPSDAFQEEDPGDLRDGVILLCGPERSDAEIEALSESTINFLLDDSTLSAAAGYSDAAQLLTCLGRAAAVRGRDDQAYEIYAEAASKGSGLAHYVLADYWLEDDPQYANALLQSSHELGFALAESGLQVVEQRTTLPETIEIPQPPSVVDWTSFEQGSLLRSLCEDSTESEFAWPAVIPSSLAEVPSVLRLAKTFYLAHVGRALAGELLQAERPEFLDPNTPLLLDHVSPNLAVLADKKLNTAELGFLKPATGLIGKGAALLTAVRKVRSGSAPWDVFVEAQLENHSWQALGRSIQNQALTDAKRLQTKVLYRGDVATFRKIYDGILRHLKKENNK